MKATCRRKASGVTHLRVTGRLRTDDTERLRLRILAVIDASGDLLIDLRGLEPWGIDVVQVVGAARRSAASRDRSVEVLCDERARDLTRLAGLDLVAGV